MADGRDIKVWTNHAAEQLNFNPQPHIVQKDFVCRSWLERSVPSGAKALDFGSGTGLWVKLFEGYDYYGTDQNEAMIMGAKQRHPDLADKFILTPWDKLPFDDGEFDVIWTSAVVQHNKTVDKEVIFKEFARVLKAGGFYMCTENTFRPDNYHTTFPKVAKWHEQLTDGYSFTWMGWRDFIEPYGFQLVERRDPGEYLFRRT